MTVAGRTYVPTKTSDSKKLAKAMAAQVGVVFIWDGLASGPGRPTPKLWKGRPEKCSGRSGSGSIPSVYLEIFFIFSIR